MTATDRARFFTGEYPPRKPRPRLRNTCHYSGRVSVIRTTHPLMPWQVVTPDGRRTHFTTYEAAVQMAHRLAHVRAMRAIVDGAQ